MHGAQSKEHRAQGSGHGALGSGYRAQSTGHRAQGHFRVRFITDRRLVIRLEEQVQKCALVYNPLPIRMGTVLKFLR